MPRYDYICSRCHHGFELRQSFDAEPVATCPVCQNGARRRISAVPVVFKGGGWYVNDYGRGRNSAGSSSESTEPIRAGVKSDQDAGPKSEPSSAEADSSSTPKPASSKTKDS